VSTGSQTFNVTGTGTGDEIIAIQLNGKFGQLNPCQGYVQDGKKVEANIAYGFTAVAINSFGFQSPASTAQVWASTLGGTPDPAQDLVATPSSETASIKFTPSANMGSLCSVKYDVTGHPGGHGTHTTVGPFPRTVSVTDLINCGKYTFTIVATNTNTGAAGKASAPSKEIEVRGDTPDPPGVSSVKEWDGGAAGGVGAQVNVTVSPPASIDNCSYTYEVDSIPPRYLGSTTALTPKGVTPTVTAKNGKPLVPPSNLPYAPCQVYTFFAFATDDKGAKSSQGKATSSPNTVVHQGIKPETPKPPTGATSTVPGEALVSFDNNTIDSTGICPYDYIVRSVPGQSMERGQSPVTVKGLTQCKNYTFNITAHNGALPSATATGDAGSSGAFVTVLGKALPVTGAAGTLSVKTYAAMSISYEVPEEVEICPFTFILNATAVGAGRHLVVTKSTRSHTAIALSAADGVQQCTNYSAVVTTVNHIGNQGPTKPFIIKEQVLPPNEPREVSAVAGDANATVMFADPLHKDFCDYTYGVHEKGKATQLSTCTASPCIAEGLLNGHVYHLVVEATNKLNQTNTSAMAGTVQPCGNLAAQHLDHETLVNMNVSVVPRDQSVIVSFDRLPIGTNGKCNLTYEVDICDAENNCTTHDAPAVVEPFTIDALANGVHYQVRVRAQNHVYRHETVLQDPVTPCAPPALPHNITLPLPGFEMAAFDWRQPFEPSCGTGKDFASKVKYHITFSTMNANSTVPDPLELSVDTNCDQSHEPADPSCTVPNLKDGTNYTVALQTVAPAGSSRVSQLWVQPCGKLSELKLDHLNTIVDPDNAQTALVQFMVKSMDAFYTLGGGCNATAYAQPNPYDAGRQSPTMPIKLGLNSLPVARLSEGDYSFVVTWDNAVTKRTGSYPGTSGNSNTVHIKAIPKPPILAICLSLLGAAFLFAVYRRREQAARKVQLDAAVEKILPEQRRRAEDAKKQEMDKQRRERNAKRRAQTRGVEKESSNGTARDGGDSRMTSRGGARTSTVPDSPDRGVEATRRPAARGRGGPEKRGAPPSPAPSPVAREPEPGDEGDEWEVAASSSGADALRQPLLGRGGSAVPVVAAGGGARRVAPRGRRAAAAAARAARGVEQGGAQQRQQQEEDPAPFEEPTVQLLQREESVDEWDDGPAPAEHQVSAASSVASVASSADDWEADSSSSLTASMTESKREKKGLEGRLERRRLKKLAAERRAAVAAGGEGAAAAGDDDDDWENEGDGWDDSAAPPELLLSEEEVAAERRVQAVAAQKAKRQADMYKEVEAIQGKKKEALLQRLVKADMQQVFVPRDVYGARAPSTYGHTMQRRGFQKLGLQFKKAHAAAPMRVSAVMGQAEALGIGVGDIVLNIDSHQVLASTSVEDAMKIMYDMGMNPIEMVFDRASLNTGRQAAKRSSMI
jgi:hypothetical protein